MNILAIDTATESCSVAVCLSGETTQLVEHVPNGHSKIVHGMVSGLFEQRRIELSDLDGIAVDIGPGSFTGVRIGIGIAQGLAFASGLPVCGISSLTALALPLAPSVVISAIDARMNQVYWSVLDTRINPEIQMAAEVSDPGVLQGRVDLLLQQHGIADAEIFGVGSGWRAYLSSMPAHAASREIRIVEDRYPMARDVAALATSAGKDAFNAPGLLTAAYVRNDVAKKSLKQTV